MMKTFVLEQDDNTALPEDWDQFTVIAYLASGRRSACVLIHDARDKTWHYRTGLRWGFFNSYRYTLHKHVGELMNAVSFQAVGPHEAIVKAIKQGRTVVGFSSYYGYTQWLAKNISA